MIMFGLGLFVWLLVAFWPKIANIWYNRNERIIYDFTKLNPTTVKSVVRPKTIEDVSRAVKNHAGKICIGGGRFSMGGQIAYPDSLHIDMRQMNSLLHFDKTKGTVIVQAGMSWKKLQEHIVPYGWAVKVMQSYNSFSIGGSVNVNVHGRYMGEGPLASTIMSLKVVLSDGSIVDCSRESNSEIFYAVIGSMGGVAIVGEVELQLAKNCRVKRRVAHVLTDTYLHYFETVTKNSPTIFHNGDIILSDYKTVRITDWEVTQDPLTIGDEFQKEKSLYLLERFIIRLVTTIPFGVYFKQKYIDPMMLRGNAVVTRNYEASYDPRELMPTSWLFNTYVLQEYFVPAEKFESFITDLQIIMKYFKPNLLNISIRHTRQDPDSLLRWARWNDTVCFVIYYKQGTSRKAQEQVQIWTQALVAAVLNSNGTYYLPYQLHPRQDQFLAAYPNAVKFAQIKQELDPEDKFTNKFWDKYLPGVAPQTSQPQTGGQA